MENHISLEELMEVLAAVAELQEEQPDRVAFEQDEIKERVNIRKMK